MIKFALKAASTEVVPFLRRIEASVKEGQSIQEAYSESLASTKVLKHVIGEPVKDLPFTEALVEGAKKSHLRSLVTFANQVKLREKSGASLKEAFIKAAATASILEETREASAPNKGRSSKQKLIIAGAGAAAAVLIARRLRR
jgi:hypothetical protein